MKLRVHSSRRHFETSSGRPFFFLADTAWELFHRLDREEMEHYFRTRAEQGFTVVKSVALAELQGLTTPNAEGHLPLQSVRGVHPQMSN